VGHKNYAFKIVLSIESNLPDWKNSYTPNEIPIDLAANTA